MHPKDGELLSHRIENLHPSLTLEFRTGIMSLES